jgi:predicted transposase YdaD
MDFFKSKPLPDAVPDYMKTALELSEAHTLSEEESRMISALERAEQDLIGQLEYARYEGREETALSVAQSLLNAGMDSKSVALHTGLDLDTIHRLKATGPNSQR